jgi:hypothetical protein
MIPTQDVSDGYESLRSFLLESDKTYRIYVLRFALKPLRVPLVLTQLEETECS